MKVFSPLRSLRLLAIELFMLVLIMTLLLYILAKLLYNIKLDHILICVSHIDNNKLVEFRNIGEMFADCQGWLMIARIARI
jgi:hypothetical protein